MSEILGARINAFPSEQSDERKVRMDATAITYFTEKFPSADCKIFFTDKYGKRHDYIVEAGAACLAFENEKLCKRCKGYECLLKRGLPVFEIKNNVYIEVRWATEKICRYHPFKRSLVQRSRLDRTTQTLEAFQTLGNNALEKALKSAYTAAQEHTSLILSGATGVGKTHLATGILLEALRHNRQGAFWLADDLLDELKRTNFEGGHDELVNELKSVFCLVLDDLGRVVPNELWGSQMYRIVESRCAKGLQTIITTNAVSPKEMENALQAVWVVPMISRMLEFGSWVNIANAEDYRLRRFR